MNQTVLCIMFYVIFCVAVILCHLDFVHKLWIILHFACIPRLLVLFCVL